MRRFVSSLSHVPCVQGDLALMSMHGLGSDVFLHLKTEAASTRECLPKFSVATIEAFNTHNKHKISHWTV